MLGIVGWLGMIITFLIIISKQQKIRMSNIHGLNDYSNHSSRRQQLRQPASSLQMLGISQSDLRLMSNQLSQNRIPFINIMRDNTEPLQESIPYTLKLVWCPAFSFFSISNFLVLAIWIMYIVCLSQGIDTTFYMVLAPKPETLRYFGAFNYQLLKDGQAWRLITAVFLHADLLQITMSTISILFFVTQLQQCFNQLVMASLMLISAISGNITVAIFADKVSLNMGTGSVVYGALGGFLAYLTINWSALPLIRGQLAAIIGIMIFFAMLFSIGGYYGFACFMGGLFGGYIGGLALFWGIRGRSWLFTAIGAATVLAYWLTMFLIFYLAL